MHTNSHTSCTLSDDDDDDDDMMNEFTLTWHNVGQNVLYLSFRVPQNRQLAFVGPKFNKFLPEL